MRMCGKRRQNFKISNTTKTSLYSSAQYVANIPCCCRTFLRRESLTFGIGKSFGLFDVNVPYPKYPFSFLCVAFRGMNAWVSQSQQRAHEFIVTSVGSKKILFFWFVNNNNLFFVSILTGCCNVTNALSIDESLTGAPPTAGVADGTIVLSANTESPLPPPQSMNLESSSDQQAKTQDDKTLLLKGPKFIPEASKNITALAGRVASLNCRIKNLDNWTV